MKNRVQPAVTGENIACPLSAELIDLMQCCKHVCFMLRHLTTLAASVMLSILWSKYQEIVLCVRPPRCLNVNECNV